MKAIPQRKFITKALVSFGGLGLAIASINGSALAQDKPLSVIGQQTGLQLYDKDKADTCVDGALQIRATINNVTSGGILKVELFGKKDFLKKEGKLRRIRVPAQDGSQRVCMNLPAPGEFALVTYNDLDGDRRLKKAWNYKPKEPYGLSNNPKIKSLRMPKFSESRFIVPMSGADISIDLVDLSK